MIVQQGNTTQAIPFEVYKDSADYHGAPGLLSQLSVTLSKNGATAVPAFGKLAEDGVGGYWLMPDARDADTVGAVKVNVAAPDGYIAPPVGFQVEAPTFWDLLGQAPQALLSIAANMRLLARYTVPAPNQGEIQ